MRCEVRFIDRGGIHLWLEGNDMVLPFERHPSLRRCTPEELFNVRYENGTLRWPEINVDIALANRSSDDTLTKLRENLESILDSLMCHAFGEARHELAGLLCDLPDTLDEYRHRLRSAHRALLYSDAGPRDAMLTLRELIREMQY